MIEVNLLPEERRPVSRTPLPRLLVILAGVAGVCFELWLLVLVVKDYREKKKDLREKLVEIGEYDEKIRQNKKLQDSIDRYAKHEGEVELLYKHRKCWSPLVYDLHASVPDNVWLSSVALKESRARSRKEKSTSVLEITGYSRAANEEDPLRMVNEFRKFEKELLSPHPDRPTLGDLIEGSPQYPDAAEVVELDIDEESAADAPKKALSFALTLTLKKPQGKK